MKNTYECEFFVAGAGISGICAAVQAGRLGLDTVIIEKEMTLGGNAGPLFGVGPSGAHVNNEFYTETGIVMEIEERLSMSGARPAQNYMAMNTSVLWDRVVCDMLKEAGVRIFRKHLVKSAVVSDSRIKSVGVLDIETLDELEFTIKGFAMDATGDAVLASLSGADTYMGRESRSETGERSAPEKGDRTISAASLMAITVDTGIPRPFVPPEGTPAWNERKPANTFDPSRKYNYIFQVDEGGRENGLNSLDTPQALYESLVERIYSIWNYFKNIKYRGRADTHELVWISPVLGRRESRRILGDYILTQTDIEENRDFKDAAGFGGFYLDYHPPSDDGGYETVFYYNPLPYQIPLRCLYSRNIRNLFSGGRAISATHLAFTSTRVMRTGGLLGQSAAIAAYMCHTKSLHPPDIAGSHIDEFRVLLKRNDVFIPGLCTVDPDNLVNEAEVTSSSEAVLDSRKVPSDSVLAYGSSEARIFSIPEKIDRMFLYVQNRRKRPGKLGLEISFGKTGEFDKNTPETGHSGEYEFSYPPREDDVSEFKMLFSKEITVPAHYTGWVAFDCRLENLEPADRKTVRKCLAVKTSGTVGIALSGQNPDFVEGNRVPVIRTMPRYAYGSALNIKDGYIHREGTGLLHKWMCQPGEGLPQSIDIDFGMKVDINEIHIVFDTTERHESEMFYCRGLDAPEKCISSYSLEAFDENEIVRIFEETGNCHRFRRIKPGKVFSASKLRLSMYDTPAGSAPGGVYEIRVYGSK